MIRFTKLAIVILLFFLLISVLGIQSINTQEVEQDLSNKRYIDPKGYFKIIPPSGWQIQEYPDDPRGKVAFIGPDIDIRILVNAVDFNTIDDLVLFCEDLETRLGLDMNIKKITFNGLPAVSRSFEYGGDKFYYIDFLIGNVDHNLAYSAAINKYDKYLPIVLKSIDTYEPILKDITDEDLTEHYLAKKIRLAQLMIDNKNYDIALELINEGLDISSNHEELLKMKEKISDIKNEGPVAEEKNDEVETVPSDKKEQPSIESTSSSEKEESKGSTIMGYIIGFAIICGIYWYWIGSRIKKKNKH
jgi:hypothetical protein